MLEALTDETLGALRLALGYHFQAAASSPEAYSAALHQWLIAEAAAEMARRVGEQAQAPPLSGLTPAESRRAATFAAAIAFTFGRIAAGLTPENMTAATRAKFARFAAELEPVMVDLAAALTEMAGASMN